MKTIKNKSEYTWYEKCVLNITSLRRMFKVRKDQMSQLCELKGQTCVIKVDYM